MALGQNLVDVQNHLAHRLGFLEHALAGAPHIALPHRLEVGQGGALGRQLVQSLQGGLNGAVVDQNIGVLGHVVKALHLDVHGGQGVFLPAQLLQGVHPSGQVDGLGDVVPRLAHRHHAVGGNGEEGHRLAGALLLQHGFQLGQLAVIVGLGRLLPVEQSAVQLHPLHPAQGVALVAGPLHQHRDAQPLQLFLHLRVVVDHGGGEGQAAALGLDELIVRGAVLAGVGHAPVLHGLTGLGDVPALGLGARQGDRVHHLQLPEAVHGGGGLEVDILQGLAENSHILRQLRRDLTILRHQQVGLLVNDDFGAALRREVHGKALGVGKVQMLAPVQPAPEKSLLRRGRGGPGGILLPGGFPLGAGAQQGRRQQEGGEKFSVCHCGLLIYASSMDA